MKLFELGVFESSVSTNGGPFVPSDGLTYGLPDEAIEVLDPILAAVGQDPNWFFDRLNFGRPPAPWAIACLDREYALAGHVAESRPTDAGIGFAGYSDLPKPLPADFAPSVGVLVFASRDGLERAAEKSPLFSAAWLALNQAHAAGRWLVTLDPLPEIWLAKVLPCDRDRWLSNASAHRFRKAAGEASS